MAPRAPSAADCHRADGRGAETGYARRRRDFHFHSLVLDGVYAAGPSGALRFHALPPPGDAEVGRVAGQVARRIVRLLERSGLAPDADPAEIDPLPDKEPLLALLYAASVAGRIATGPRAGQRVLRVGDRIDVDDVSVLEGERCASVGGVSLHANVAVPARDRRRLERLARYVARPPVSTQRLSRLDDGRLLYRLKHRWRDGTTHVVFEGQELLEKLAALVPPPRFHLVRYHGILGPCAGERDRVVPGGQAAVGEAPACDVLDPSSPDAAGSAASGRAPPTTGLPPDSSDREPVDAVPAPLLQSTPELPRSDRPRRMAWADLLRRVFAIEILECPRCGSRTRILAAIHPPTPCERSSSASRCLHVPHPRSRLGPTTTRAGRARCERLHPTPEHDGPSSEAPPEATRPPWRRGRRREPADRGPRSGPRPARAGLNPPHYGRGSRSSPGVA